MFSVFACGAVFFPGLFYSFRKILRSTFANWTEADVVAVSERLLSAVHGALATTAGIVVVSSCKEVMTDRHWLVNGFVWFGAPYMAYDIYAMYLSHYHSQKVKGQDEAYRGHSLRTVKRFLLRDRLLVLHHMTLLLVFMPICLFYRRGLGDFFIGCFFTTEGSTPFVSLGKILIQLGLQDSRLHWINGVTVLLSFFCCRILLFPFMYWMYGRQYGIPLYRVPLALPLHCNLGNLAILAPQVYWFLLLCRKAQRLYLRSRAQGEDPKGTDRPKTQ
ncbi:TLC domain-containing protein 3A-like [Aplochiton taeniatus]